MMFKFLDPGHILIRASNAEPMSIVSYLHFFFFQPTSKHIRPRVPATSPLVFLRLFCSLFIRHGFQKFCLGQPQPTHDIFQVSPRLRIFYGFIKIQANKPPIQILGVGQQVSQTRDFPAMTVDPPSSPISLWNLTFPLLERLEHGFDMPGTPKEGHDLHHNFRW